MTILTLKRAIEFDGGGVSGPRTVLQEAFVRGLVSEAKLWISALEDRNLTAHTYNEEFAKEMALRIEKNYMPLFKSLIDQMSQMFP